MSLANAVGFLSCVFRYHPIQQRILHLELGDADGLSHIAQGLGYQLAEKELLIALEYALDHLLAGIQPTEAEIRAHFEESPYYHYWEEPALV